MDGFRQALHVDARQMTPLLNYFNERGNNDGPAFKLCRRCFFGVARDLRFYGFFAKESDIEAVYVLIRCGILLFKREQTKFGLFPSKCMKYSLLDKMH